MGDMGSGHSNATRLHSRAQEADWTASVTCRWTARLRWSCAGSIRSPAFHRSGCSGQVGRAAQPCPATGFVMSPVSRTQICMHEMIGHLPALGRPAHMLHCALWGGVGVVFWHHG